MPVKRVSALSQVLKETQQTTIQSTEGATPPQSSNTGLPQNVNTGGTQSRNTEIREGVENAKLQSGTTEIPQKSRKTDTRVKLTFYLDPEDTQKLDTLRYTYNLQHGLRLDQNKFMRLIVKHLDLSLLEQPER